jgi:protein-arginine kinase activator protein McsA
MTTRYIPRITREDAGDFLAELSVWTDGPVPETIFVGYFSTYQAAYEAATEASTDAAQRDVADAALAMIAPCACGAQLTNATAYELDNAPACKTCLNERLALAELVAAVFDADNDDCADNRAQALLDDEWLQSDTPACRTCGGPVEIDGDDECSDCYALACERCGKPVSFEDAFILGDEMVCAACYAAQQAHVEAMAELVAADERREYRESLEKAGQAEDAQRMAEALQAAFSGA